jgi:hypothetical protein
LAFVCFSPGLRFVLSRFDPGLSWLVLGFYLGRAALSIGIDVLIILVSQGVNSYWPEGYVNDVHR